MPMTEKQKQRFFESSESREARAKFRKKRRDAEASMKSPYAAYYPEAKAYLKEIVRQQQNNASLTLVRLQAFCEKYPAMVLQDDEDFHVNTFLATPFRKALISALYTIAEEDGFRRAALETTDMIQTIGFRCPLTSRLYRHLHYFEAANRFERYAQENGPKQAAQCANHEAEEWTGLASRRNHLIKIAQRFIDLAS